MDDLEDLDDEGRIDAAAGRGRQGHEERMGPSHKRPSIYTVGKLRCFLLVCLRDKRLVHVDDLGKAALDGSTSIRVLISVEQVRVPVGGEVDHFRRPRYKSSLDWHDERILVSESKES